MTQTQKAQRIRPLSDIAWEIQSDWKKPYFGAVPYIRTMSELNSISDMYYADTAASIVTYFLSNASSWRGEVARRVKRELSSMLERHQRRV